MTSRTRRAALAAAVLAPWILAAPTATAQDAEPAPSAQPRKAPPRKHQAAPKPKAAAQQPAPAPVTVPVPSPADLQPIQHARNAGVSACLNAIGQASVATVDGPHKAHSSWLTTAPDAHVFQSIVGIDYRNKTAPNAAAIISATPTQDRGCDTTTVQVYPTARTCPQLRAELMRDGSLTDELSGMPLIRSASGFQHLLVPGPGTGCVIVAVGLGVQPPKPVAVQQQQPIAQPQVAQQPAPVQQPAGPAPSAAPPANKAAR